MNEAYKEVYFHEYCSTCKYSTLTADEDPCHECLAHPFNPYSHKPTKFEEKENK